MLLVTGCATENKVIAQSPRQTASAHREESSGQITSARPRDPSEGPASADTRKDFIRRIVGDTEDVWTQIFKSIGAQYEPPTLVLFTRSAESSCGIMSAAAPFYCPSDQKVYLDIAFPSQLPVPRGSLGDFAQAYLIVHEISHHVQKSLRTTQQFESALSGLSVMAKRQREQLQVRFELQADCYVGVWTFYVQKRKLLDPGDLEEVLSAQALSDTPTYGTAAQRLWWFKRGLATGAPLQCDTLIVSEP